MPAQRIGERGTKIRCSGCGASLIVRPPGFTGRELDLQTEDWTPDPFREALPETVPVEPHDVPGAIKAIFAGTGERLTLHPPGTVPPVQRVSAPRSADAHHALSVTPPPPRSVEFTASASLRPAPSREPAPRRATIPPPALRDDTPAGVGRRAQAPQAAPQSAAELLGLAASARATAPVAPNRGEATGDRVAREGAPPAASAPTPTYAPPWGATPGAPPAWNASTGAPPPWVQGAPWPTHPALSHTHPGAPYATHPGMTYAAPWGTAAPAGTHPGPPMITSWQPAWVPAIVLGMERGTLAALLGAVLVVGFVGGCMGVGSSQVAAALGSMIAPAAPVDAPAVVPGTGPAPDEPRGASVVVERDPPFDPATARLPVAPEKSGVRVKVVRPAPPSAPAPGTAPFEVDASDVRDPWDDR